MAISFLFLVEPNGQVTGFNIMLEKLQKIFNYAPIFDNLLFTAGMLLIFIGVPLIMSALFLIARMYCGIIFAIISGVILIVGNVFVLAIYGTDFILFVGLILGLVLLACSVLTFLFYYKYVFYFNEADYNRLGYNPRELVVYYSRTTYIKKYAYELANSLEADIIALSPYDDFKGNKGFFRYVKALFLHRPEPIYEIEIGQYENIHCVFESFMSYTSPPMMSFFEAYGHKIKTPELICVYFAPLGVKKYLCNLKDYFRDPIDHILAVKMKYGVVRKMYEIKK